MEAHSGVNSQNILFSVDYGAPEEIRTPDPQIRSLLPPISRPISRAHGRRGFYFGICLRLGDTLVPAAMRIPRLAAKLRDQARGCGVASA
jgi:hypothetical protein